MELTQNEKRLLAFLGERGEATPEETARALSGGEDAVIQHALLLQEKGLVDLQTTVVERYRLTPEGERYAAEGLPERQLLESFGERTELRLLTAHPLSSIAIGWMRKKGWIRIRNGIVEKTGMAPAGMDELALKDVAQGGEGARELARRGLATVDRETRYRISITEEGRKRLAEGLDLSEEVETLTRDLIVTGRWRDVKFRRFSVEKIPKRVFPGKSHPYQRLLEEMRQILLQMGFEEIYGDIVQTSFWNFDALFQPQDHPAREMQDTFYLDLYRPLPPGWEAVRETHETGGATSSTGWGGRWDPKRSEQCVLRTHTTTLTIQHLARHPQPPVKAFCIGRVYRREAIDPTHLPEFEQLEGVVMDRGVTFRHLLGILKEFYARMGFEDIRFRPGYFPYTEPSVEPEVWVEGLGWVELGGAGVFREEVTRPFGIMEPVLAWGLGVSRVAMIRLGLKDLRQLYRSDVDWVRESPIYMSMTKERGA
ncbi:MAG: phenylalanine--tRNA ligase subunit alpha [Methanomicrobiales archaeon]|nr:phenylalanine--tRNA ligase subunit alpha [Methanomicrobiales archaeon]